MYLHATREVDGGQARSGASSLLMKLPRTRHAILTSIALQATERIYTKFPKYRQRLTSTGRMFHGARFEDDPNFKTRNHIHTTTLPEPAGKNELEELVRRTNTKLCQCCKTDNSWDTDGQVYRPKLGPYEAAVGNGYCGELSR